MSGNMSDHTRRPKQNTIAKRAYYNQQDSAPMEEKDSLNDVYLDTTSLSSDDSGNNQLRCGSTIKHRRSGGGPMRPSQWRTWRRGRVQPLLGDFIMDRADFIQVTPPVKQPLEQRLYNRFLLLDKGTIVGLYCALLVVWPAIFWLSISVLRLSPFVRRDP